VKEITAYLNFDGNCREAMTFYQKCLGAELQMMAFSDMPPAPGQPPVPKEVKDRIMHARLAKGPTVLMASDTMPGMGQPFQQGNNSSLALGCESVQEVDKLFAALSEKGKPIMPPQETFWAARFGMLTDKFGVNWMFNFEKPKQTPKQKSKPKSKRKSKRK
jgi:PhnB protein